ncbi:glycosyltransferase [uncultured Ornithinimicrobium sp.]|uniref:glycosyltransferase n=1 Tax=uncultured Ornithinimicrobium sp. TaxID=259307 RepID=UPI00259A05E1|nr:hypothetical protein [uncultured Ornithinimicrobium sp.]
MKKISAVILNWRRPDNVRLILDEWRASGIIDEAIVWNNNPSSPFCHEWGTVINTNCDMGLYTRFAAVALARHGVVWIQDDDVLVPADTIRMVLEAWRQEPAVLHGLFGRAPRADGTYALELLEDCEAPMILTRALMTARSNAATFFAAIGEFEELQMSSDPRGNGEDIVFSYAVLRQSRRLHRVHRLPCHELPAPDAIHRRDWPTHVSHRTNLMRACESWVQTH